MIYAYSKAFKLEQTEFSISIGSQYIWGNKFITKNIGKKKSVLFLRNWIRSGVRKVSDLNFIDGKLDEQFVYNIITDKTNIYVEIAIVKNSLLKYRNALRNMTQNENITERILTAKGFYSKFVQEKENDIGTYSNFLTAQINIDEESAFTQKVSNEREHKLKEYNFKLLHGILACNKNLKRWRIKDRDICDVCAETQTIKHLLFDCQYVRNIWLRMKDVFNIDITFTMLLGDMQSTKYNNIVTLLGFIIYKEWLLHSLDNKNRRPIQDFRFVKEEIELRIKIYKKCRIMKQLDIDILEKYVEELM